MATFKCMGPKEFEDYKKKQFDEIKDHLRSPTASANQPNPDFESPKYKFDYPNRGLAVIFNNINFEGHKDSERSGAEHDETKLSETFRDLGFDVIIFRDLTADQIFKTATEASKIYKHEEADCFACFFSSHGENLVKKGAVKNGVVEMDHVLLGSDCRCLATKKIINLFEDDCCQGLMYKPRLFFIQACRGSTYDEGVVLEGPGAKSTALSGDDNDKVDGVFGEMRTVKVLSVPLYQDCLTMYATPPGYYAWRGETTGSWFITELCKVLKNHDDIEDVSLLRVLTVVSHAVAKNYISSAKEESASGKLQMPVIESMLTKDIFMAKKDPTIKLK